MQLKCKFMRLTSKGPYSMFSEPSHLLQFEIGSGKAKIEFS